MTNFEKIKSMRRIIQKNGWGGNMTIKLVNMYDNTIRILESKSADIPLLFSSNGPAYLINNNCYDADEWYWEELKIQ